MRIGFLPSSPFRTHIFKDLESKFSRPVRQTEKVITNFTFSYSAMQRILVDKRGFKIHVQYILTNSHFFLMFKHYTPILQKRTEYKYIYTFFPIIIINEHCAKDKIFFHLISSIRWKTLNELLFSRGYTSQVVTKRNLFHTILLGLKPKLPLR